jgi:thioredoxin-dependent peroxiredoxin
MAIEMGKRFVDFSLQNQDGETVTLNDFAGKWLVVYVYPKDDTPGCTIQGKSFTATKQEFDDANIAVVGVSADDVASHKDFCSKFSFTIDLLADPNHELLSAAGVGQSEYKGTMYWDRTSFVIDPEGTLRKTYLKVNPEGHERVLLNDIKELQ